MHISKVTYSLFVRLSRILLFFKERKGVYAAITAYVQSYLTYQSAVLIHLGSTES